MLDEVSDAFLAKIWTSDDLSPWLIFADYLDDQGHDRRAQFLRLSCQLAQLRQDDPALAMQVSRQRQQLLDELAKLGELDEAPEVWLAWHWDLKRDLHRHLQRPGVTVDLANLKLSNAGARALFACPLLSHAYQLRLRYTGIRTAGMQQLAQSPYLTNLKELDVSWNLVCDVGVAAVAFSPHLRQLARLNLAYCYLTKGAGRSLAESPLVQQLSWLDLTCNTLPEDERLLLRERFGRLVHGLYPPRVR